MTKEDAAIHIHPDKEGEEMGLLFDEQSKIWRNPEAFHGGWFQVHPNPRYGRFDVYLSDDDTLTGEKLFLGSFPNIVEATFFCQSYGENVLRAREHARKVLAAQDEYRKTH